MPFINKQVSEFVAHVIVGKPIAMKALSTEKIRHFDVLASKNS